MTTTHARAGAQSLLTLALFASPMALTQGTGWYGAASAGRTGAEIDDARITGGLLAQGFTTSSIEDRDRSNGFKLNGGCPFNPSVALEGGYFDLGKSGYTANTTNPVPGGGLIGDMRVRGLNLDLVSSLSLTGHELLPGPPRPICGLRLHRAGSIARHARRRAHRPAGFGRLQPDAV